MVFIDQHMIDVGMEGASQFLYSRNFETRAAYLSAGRGQKKDKICPVIFAETKKNKKKKICLGGQKKKSKKQRVGKKGKY